jgi:hypothetical protein
MVWVYETTHLSSDEERIVKFLSKRTNPKLAERSVKLLNLFLYLKKHTFRSPKSVQESAFYDKEHTRPIFTDKGAKEVYTSLKQKGGLSRSYPTTDAAIRSVISTIQSIFPQVVRDGINGVYSRVTGTVVSVQERLPLLRFASKLFRTGAKAAEATADTVATDVAGPVGAAAVAIPVAAVGLAATAASVAEDDLGGAASQMVQALPLIGNAGTAILNGIEDWNRPLPAQPEAVKKAGKRFSTRRHKITKCPKTRRNRSGTS